MSTGRTSAAKRLLAVHLRERHGRVIELSYATEDELRDIHEVIDPTCLFGRELVGAGLSEMVGEK